MTRLRVALLASGRGSHFASLAAAARAGDLPIELVGVFSDKAGAPVLQRAAESGVGAQLFEPRRYADRDAHERALFEAVDATSPDLIVCAGYMRILGAGIVARFAGRMINIHPSLLPRHKGLHTHQQALDAGDAEHGASVHFVNAELDGGAVIAQARVPVLPGDDAAALAARVLAVEHPLLVATLELACAGRLAERDGKAWVDAHPLFNPLTLDCAGRLHG